jgi:signal peptidase I
MMPTLNEMGDVVLVDKLSPRWRPIQRNEIVIADSSYKRDFAICKRVVGLPGDVITPPASARRLYNTTTRTVVVPPGHVWLEGDNPQNSVDSRQYGPVPAALIRGRVCAKLWPLSQAQTFDGSQPRPTANTLYRSALLADGDIVADAQRRWAERHAALSARAAAEADEEARLQRLLAAAGVLQDAFASSNTNGAHGGSGNCANVRGEVEQSIVAAALHTTAEARALVGAGATDTAAADFAVGEANGDLHVAGDTVVGLETTIT